MPDDAEDGGGVGSFQLSGFVARRMLAFGYCAAFLSLLAQLDGLFGCDGVQPPKSKGQLALAGIPGGDVPFIIAIVAFLGAILAGAAFVAVEALERRPLVTFSALLAAFASCVQLAPAFYPQFEDKILMETGLAALFALVHRRGGGDAGRALAAFLLFRCVFTPVAARCMSSCDTWRGLEALGDSYQVDAFPLQVTWLIFLAPATVIRGLTAMYMFCKILLCPLLLAPSRAVRMPVLTIQLGMLIVDSFLANHGCSNICLASLAFSLLDDSWHTAIWSERLLLSWGFEDIDDDDEGENTKTDQSAQSGSSPWLVGLLLALVAIVASVACAFTIFPEAAGSVDMTLVMRCLAGAGAVGVLFGFLAGVSAGMRTGNKGSTVVAMLGSVLVLCGALQLTKDMMRPTSLPTPLAAVAKQLESLHISHALSRSNDLCAHPDGRADIVVQGGMTSEQFAEVKFSKTGWIDLSSRFLPSTEDRRPVWVQPYTPRLDQQFWQLAQGKKPKVPPWMLRLLVRLAVRQGSAAQLSAGPWQGLSAQLYGGHPEYKVITPPLPVMRVLWFRHRLIRDIHSNKWWNKTETKVLKELMPEDIEQAMQRYAPVCSPLPWAEQPVAEITASLIVIAFIGQVLVRTPT